VRVVRVEILRIDPPPDVVASMHHQMQSERTRRAVVTEALGVREAAVTRAEGEKQAAVTRAEGEKQSAILQGEGPAQARLRNADTEAEAIAQVARVMLDHGNPAQYLITQRYIESLKEMSLGQNSKVIFMPVETSAMLSSVGVIKEMFAETGEKRKDDTQQLPPGRPRQLPNA